MNEVRINEKNETEKQVRLFTTVKRNLPIVYSLSFALMALICVCFFFGKSFDSSYKLLKIGYCIIFPTIGTMIVAVLFTEHNIISFFRSRKTQVTCFVLFFCILVAMLPLYTNNYLFMDDTYNFWGSETIDIGCGLRYYRPFMSVPSAIFASWTLDTSYIARAVMAILLGVFAFILYAWIYHYSRAFWFSFFTALSIGICVTSADVVGLLAISPMIVGLIYTELSVILFTLSEQKKGKSKRYRLCLLICSALVMFMAFNQYAISTPFLFVLLAIRLFYRRFDKKHFQYLLKYSCVVILAGISYVVVAKWFIGHYAIQDAQTARSEISVSLPILIDRIKLFFTDTIPQCAYRIVALWFNRNELFVSNNLYFATMPINSNIGKFMYMGILVIILFAFIRQFRREHSFWGMIALFCFLLLSDYSFFVLPDITYMSYYRFPVLCTVLFFTIAGLNELIVIASNGVSCFNKKKDIANGVIISHGKKAMIIGLCCISILQTYDYCQKWWVGYTVTAQTIIKDQIVRLINSGKLVEGTSIHLIGNVSPVMVPAYTINTTNHVLQEMGIDYTQFLITQSDSDEYANLIMDSEYSSISETMSEEELDVFHKFYTHSEYYGFYQRNDQIPTEEESKALIQTLRENGKLPDPETALIIDLRTVDSLRRF